MKYRRLGRTGERISVLSLGGAAIGQQYGPVSVSEVAETVKLAIDAGINFIDTSAYYGEGRSEEILGEVLADGIGDSILLGTKAGRISKDHFDFSEKGMRDCFEGSLKRLRVNNVDILLAHDIEFASNPEQVFTETAETLHRLKAEGKTRFVGMSGLPLPILKQAVERCNLDLLITYCHYHLQDQTLLDDLLPVAEAHGVGIINASPLAMGLLTNQGPPVWHPADDGIKQACASAAKFCRSQEGDISALGLQYCLGEPRIASTITGTAKADELKRNLEAWKTPIDESLLSAVRELLEPVRNRTWPSGSSIRHSP